MLRGARWWCFGFKVTETSRRGQLCSGCSGPALNATIQKTKKNENRSTEIRKLGKIFIIEFHTQPRKIAFNELRHCLFSFLPSSRSFQPVEHSRAASFPGLFAAFHKPSTLPRVTKFKQCSHVFRPIVHIFERKPFDKVHWMGRAKIIIDVPLLWLEAWRGALF